MENKSNGFLKAIKKIAIYVIGSIILGFIVMSGQNYLQSKLNAQDIKHATSQMENIKKEFKENMKEVNKKLDMLIKELIKGDK